MSKLGFIQNDSQYQDNICSSPQLTDENTFSKDIVTVETKKNTVGNVTNVSLRIFQPVLSTCDNWQVTDECLTSFNPINIERQTAIVNNFCKNDKKNSIRKEKS